MRVSEMNKRIARLLVSAHFPAMTAAAVVRRPGGCHPSRRVHRMVLIRRRQLSIEYGSIGNIVCIIYFFFLFNYKLFTGLYYSYMLMLYYK